MCAIVRISCYKETFFNKRKENGKPPYNLYIHIFNLNSLSQRSSKTFHTNFFFDALAVFLCLKYSDLLR